MTLAEYITAEQTSASALAEKAGCAVSTITRVLNGERSPSLELAIRIQQLTGGRVRPESFVPTTTEAGAGS